ncbi:hypothetical protein E2986_14104 [Frieseomelitta varia]|uniref:Uncharacterized protein n=1 Tax=Frieseomelitta varia TaxID=561572 RepID=A0A833SA98_9HYME|nr:hypothetical protein E2986_14104 [Frieseomelitta varia]
MSKESLYVEHEKCVFVKHGINGNFCVAPALARGALLLFSRQLSAQFLRGFRLDDAHLRPRHEETNDSNPSRYTIRSVAKDTLSRFSHESQESNRVSLFETSQQTSARTERGLYFSLAEEAVLAFRVFRGPLMTTTWCYHRR